MKIKSNKTYEMCETANLHVAHVPKSISLFPSHQLVVTATRCQIGHPHLLQICLLLGSRSPVDEDISISTTVDKRFEHNLLTKAECTFVKVDVEESKDLVKIMTPVIKSMTRFSFFAIFVLILAIEFVDGFISSVFSLRYTSNVESRIRFHGIYMVSPKKERWQDLAEDLANPLKSPLEKPAVLQKLFGRVQEISDSLGDVVTGKVPS
jgi:hypothetical protein